MDRPIWIFVASGAQFPAGVFNDLPSAEAWIARHGLTGMLTAYPVGVGVFDWAVATGNFSPKPSKKIDSKFIGRFTTAKMEHHHYEDGNRQA